MVTFTIFFSSGLSNLVYQIRYTQNWYIVLQTDLKYPLILIRFKKKLGEKEIKSKNFQLVCTETLTQDLIFLYILYSIVEQQFFILKEIVSWSSFPIILKILGASKESLGATASDRCKFGESSFIGIKSMSQCKFHQSDSLGVKQIRNHKLQ